MRRLSTRILVAASLALGLLGCGDDDAVSPIAPADGLTGMWVRYVPPPPPGLPVALPRLIVDTLFVSNDLTGLWSRELDASMGIVPLRNTEAVRIVPQGPLLHLVVVVPPCLACDAPVGDRFTSLAPNGGYLIERTDADHLVIRESAPRASPIAFPYGPAYYVRTQYTGSIPD